MSLKAYPTLRPLIFLILGIIAAEYFQISSFVLIFLAIGVVAGLFTGFYFKHATVLSIALFTGLAALGFLLSRKQKMEVDFPLEQIDAYVARVSSSGETKPKSYKSEAEIIQIKHQGQWRDVDLKMLLYINSTDSLVPRYGDIFLINEAPRLIEGVKNPFEFNYQKFQFNRGIPAHHFLRKGDYVLLGSQPKSQIKNWAYTLNSKARDILKNALEDPKDLAVAEAMLVGAKDDLDNETRDAYATAGAVHILAVSGLHVGILMLLINYLLGFLKKFKNGHVILGLTTVILLWLYALFTGLSPSVTRATLMFSLFQLGTIIRRDKNSINVLAGSALTLLVFRPNWLFEVGFQLSYLAMFGIIFLYPYLNRLIEPKNKLLSHLWQISVVSVSAQLFTLPLSLYYFHQFPSYFLLTNPLVTVASMGVLFTGLPYLILSGVPLISDFLQAALSFVLKLLNFSVVSISHLPNAKLSGFHLDVVEATTLYLLLFLLIFFFIRRQPTLLKTGVLVAFGLTAFNVKTDLTQMNQQELTLHFIPRGSGISIIDSKTAIFICDSLTEANPRAYDFHLKNYYDARGIRNYTISREPDVDDMLAFEFKNKKNLWIRKYFRQPIDELFDKIMVSQNAVYDINKQFSVFPKTLILDDTNSRYRIEKLKAQADTLGVHLISLYDTGGLTFRE
ncbi:ComEC/Rec2 family competence protein [Jiulongibacter sediminis]|uniref:Competence protein ComEC n=1 Tax=Jiulongibacter sediminis TaxID=1605367 RepID=A0A0P7C829_9BACT|nr:ComEC/Rec2 family competence protein [Jiulongibacter sediminis]KPM48623.1 hypothetical protein AFM12_08420 [Jiulongibacter sediminis]TBX25161.1 hypothetical protein TK44_08425 [Jiulongibacter sediminis]